MRMLQELVQKRLKFERVSSDETLRCCRVMQLRSRADGMGSRVFGYRTRG